MTIGEMLRGKSNDFEPKTMEVWEVEDKDIRFVPDENRRLHIKRYVLILMKKELCVIKNEVFNIVPMSTKGNPDNLKFPLKKDCYSNIDDNDLINKAQSLLVLNHYQPINSKYLIKRAGRLNEEIYCAITNQIKEELLGIVDDDSFDDEDYLKSL